MNSRESHLHRLAPKDGVETEAGGSSQIAKEVAREAVTAVASNTAAHQHHETGVDALGKRKRDENNEGVGARQADPVLQPVQAAAPVSGSAVSDWIRASMIQQQMMSLQPGQGLGSLPQLPTSPPRVGTNALLGLGPSISSLLTPGLNIGNQPLSLASQTFQQPASYADQLSRLRVQDYGSQSILLTGVNQGLTADRVQLILEEQSLVNLLRQQQLQQQVQFPPSQASPFAILSRARPPNQRQERIPPVAAPISSAPLPPREPHSPLPKVVSHKDDDTVLSGHQVLLRKQIEAFEADQHDSATHTRGRNKAIILHQVGIRCRHCGHRPVNERAKGSTYYPTSVMGLYQAAQNMCHTHMQSGICKDMPQEIKDEFVELLKTKYLYVGAGRAYWARTAKGIGLYDTEEGIRFSVNSHET